MKPISLLLFLLTFTLNAYSIQGTMTNFLRFVQTNGKTTFKYETNQAIQIKINVANCSDVLEIRSRVTWTSNLYNNYVNTRTNMPTIVDMYECKMDENQQSYISFPQLPFEVALIPALNTARLGFEHSGFLNTYEFEIDLAGKYEAVILPGATFATPKKIVEVASTGFCGSSSCLSKIAYQPAGSSKYQMQLSGPKAEFLNRIVSGGVILEILDGNTVIHTASVGANAFSFKKDTYSFADPLAKKSKSGIQKMSLMPSRGNPEQIVIVIMGYASIPSANALIVRIRSGDATLVIPGAWQKAGTKLFNLTKPAF